MWTCIILDFFSTEASVQELIIIDDDDDVDDENSTVYPERNDDEQSNLSSDVDMDALLDDIFGDSEDGLKILGDDGKFSEHNTVLHNHIYYYY